ncbi:MAG TPA: SufD family Fe-S cluster assembly protein [Candidatus Babeliales bacterium]|nr:SufD family Fe-S cluster assembly protein [Candidatus Babeliales bacterium]
MVYTYVINENQQKNYNFLFDNSNHADNVFIQFDVHQNATLVAEILIAHTNVNITINCILRGEGADARITGIYILEQSNTIKINTLQHHQSAHTRSLLIMKGALCDNARVNYQGTIRVEQKARGTHASQENKNILLSNGAHAVSIPNLEVLTHDVHCFHASAIGKFDADQLFYTASRGIDEKIAQQLLLHAFFEKLFFDTLLIEKVKLLLE